MPKKQKGPFYFFMKEQQDRCYSEQGRRIGMNELVDLCHPLYKNLTSAEREIYEQMAIDYKNQARVTLEGKLCSDGTVLALNIQAEQERGEIAESDTRAVTRMISEIESVDDVLDKEFYIVCFNVLCITDDGEYIPNEIGVVKYSLRLGINDFYHSFIDPGCIPLGYTHASKQHSDDTHKIPISGFELANKDYERIYRDFLDIVNPNENVVVPVFCIEETLNQNRGCLQWLASKAGLSSLECIHFYDLTCLLMELRAYIGSPLPSRYVAVDFLSNNAFNYTPNTRCDFHEDLDNAYCALGCAKRVCFMLSDALCPMYDIDCTTNHLPPRVGDIVQMDMIQPVFPSTRSFIPPKLPEQYAVPRNVSMTCNSLIGKEPDKAAKSTDTDHSRSWMKEFRQPQPEIASLSENNFSPLNTGKPSKPGETRQPSTVPLVLNQGAFPPKPEFALLGRGRGIGRGKQPPID